MDYSALSRRRFLKSIGAGAAIASLPSWLRAADDGKRPNIIFIMTDDHAAHALSCYGSRINQTPNLDRLANGGMRFDNCFCTNSICAPSRAVILTGKYSHRNGLMRNGDRFDSEQLTFPKLLQKAGYATALIGKWHLETDPTGFDYWNILPGQGIYHDPELIEMGHRSKHTGYVTDIITDLSIDWIKQQPSDRPFLLMCQHKAPHRHWQPDEKHATLYENKDIPEPETFNDDYSTRCDAARHQAMTIEHDMYPSDFKVEPPEGLAGQALKQWKYQHFIKDYLRCIASVDDNVGRLLDYLDENDLAENTIVVYTSDQGFFLGDHGWYDKRFMYEESLRMPLLVRYPREIKPGSVTREIVLNLDFAETFLDYADLTPPTEMQGASFQRILKGRKPDDWRSAMYYHYYEYGDLGKNGWHRVRPHVGVRTQRYKLIHFHDEQIDAWELFDLKKDPHEIRNVIGDPDYTEVVNQLKKELIRLQKDYGDVPIASPDAVRQP